MGLVHPISARNMWRVRCPNSQINQPLDYLLIQYLKGIYDLGMYLFLISTIRAEVFERLASNVSTWAFAQIDINDRRFLHIIPQLLYSVSCWCRMKHQHCSGKQPCSLTKYLLILTYQRYTTPYHLGYIDLPFFFIQKTTETFHKGCVVTLDNWVQASISRHYCLECLYKLFYLKNAQRLTDFK